MNDYNIQEIEEAYELNLDFDNLKFEKIQNIEVVKYKGKVHDLEIDTLHNYQVDNLGIVHNGGGRRKGSFAIYLEPWHADVYTWLDLKKPTGKDEVRARDLFYALWVPDLFMERVQNNEVWSLMCPQECPGLWDTHGENFEKLYTLYENKGKFKKQVNARDLWVKILQLQIETGSPYILYKDAANRKSNQQNLGTIRSSNLCLTGDTIVTIKSKVKVESRKEIPHFEKVTTTLKEVVERFQNGEELEVKCKEIYDRVQSNVTFHKITNAAMTNSNAELYKVTDEETGKSITGTFDHLVYTKNRGYVKLGELQSTDELDIENFLDTLI